jgi:uncharacterized protein (TIGR02266 family)
MFTLAHEETYEDGQVIFLEGSSGDWVYVVLSGKVEISRNIGGKRYVIEILKEGEVFGELSFLGGIKRSASAQAVGSTTVGIINRDYMDREFNKLSSEFRSILVAVVRRFKNMIDQTSDISIRADATTLKVLSMTFKDHQSFLKAYTGDAKSGGLFIRTDKALGQGEQFLLRLQLPGFPQSMKIKCTVAWVRKKEEGTEARPAGMGVKFMEMAKRDSITFQKYLQSLLKG